MYSFDHAIIWRKVYMSKPVQSLCFDVIYDIFVPVSLFCPSFDLILLVPSVPMLGP